MFGCEERHVAALCRQDLDGSALAVERLVAQEEFFSRLHRQLRPPSQDFEGKPAGCKGLGLGSLIGEAYAPLLYSQHPGR